MKVNKASLNDYISNKLLKAIADVLAAPICALINTSIDKELSQPVEDVQDSADSQVFTS